MIASFNVLRGGFTCRVSGPGLNKSLAVSRAGEVRLKFVGTQGMAGASQVAPAGPEFTYDVTGPLTRIDYDDGSFKVFAYDAGNGGRLDHVDFTVGPVTTRKQFLYNLDGTLHEIVPSTL